MPEPTDVQLKVLKLIFASVEKRGFPPTIRELCDDMDISSTNGMSEHLKALKKKGLIDREERVARGVRLTQRGRDLLTARAA